MDIQLDTGPVIPSPSLDSTIACNEVESLPACCVCGDLDPIYLGPCPLGNKTSEYISIVDCQETKDNCHICALLWTISAPYQHLIVPHKTSAEVGTVKFWLNSKDWLCISVYEPSKGLLNLEVFTPTEYTCPFPAIKPMRMISEYTGSDRTLAQISHWIQECVHNHEHSSRTQVPTLLPKRLVEILGPEKVVLRTVNTDTAGFYVALSHCWGRKRFIQTTKSSLLQYQQKICWNDLPKTFKEAVDITRRLGVRYLWIDSLCIVQDDIDDWREEGSKMASIYSGSYLTIAASKSSDSAGGCFAKYAPTDVSQSYEFLNTNGHKYSVALRKMLGHPDYYGHHDFPIFDRAWVLQERLLSPRTIHFGPLEVLWECNETKTCECTYWTDMHHNGSKAYIMGKKTSKPSWESLESPAARWRELVEVYSRLQLTDERDIFPAIQGIAKYFHEKMQCAYYAGLWESSLIEDLLWFGMRSPDSQSRPMSWRAPTWSWASTYQASWDFDSDLQALATVVAISTIPVGSDPFGEICGGELQLKGRCVDAMLMEVIDTEVDDVEKNRSIVLKVKNGGKEDVIDGDFSPDSTPSLRGNTTAKIMEMGVTTETTHSHELYFYLVFQCVDEEQQVYERIGIVSPDIYDDPYELLWHCERYGEELVLRVV